MEGGLQLPSKSHGASEAAGREALEVLDAHYAALMKLLRATPPPPGSDATGDADPDEVLQARALSVLGVARARDERRTEEANAVVLRGDQLETLVKSVAKVVHDDRDEVAQLMDAIVETQRAQLTEDAVRVIAAKVVAGIVVALTALGTLIAVIVKLA